MKIQYVDKQGVETILKLLKNKISSIVDAVVFRGTVTSVADLPLLSDPDIKPGYMYTVLTESQTTADFVEGAGETIDPYTEVVVVNQGTVLNPEYKWYVLGNVFTTKDKISYGQSLPSMPYDGMLFFYMGPDVTTPGNELYSNSFYAYNESENTWDYLWTLDDKIWRGTQAEWDALSAAEKDKYEQAEIIGLDNNGVVYVVDRIEEGNMNPVTSNAVAKYTVDKIESGNLNPVTSNAVSKLAWGANIGGVIRQSKQDITWSNQALMPAAQGCTITIPKTGLYNVGMFMDQTGSSITSGSAFFILTGTGTAADGRYRKTLGNLSDRLNDYRMETYFLKKGSTLNLSVYDVGPNSHVISNLVLDASCILDLSSIYDN